MEIVVDACGKDERAMGWYYYLDEKLGLPGRNTDTGRPVRRVRRGPMILVIDPSARYGSS
jgi:hypothetical protein